MQLRGQGFLLALTLMVGSALLFLAVTVLSFVETRRDLVRRLETEWKAEAAAAAGLERCRLALSQNSDWKVGFPKTALDSSSSFQVSFDPRQQPYSTNNVHSTNTVQGFRGRNVPVGWVHLICVGTCGRSTFAAQALVCVQGDLLLEDFHKLPSGHAELGGGGRGSWVGGSRRWEDYRLEVEARLAEGVGELSLLVRAQEKDREWTGVRFSYDSEKDVFRLQDQVIPRSATPLADLHPQWCSEEFHDYALRIIGDQVECEVDEHPIATGTVEGDCRRGRAVVMTSGHSREDWYLDFVRVVSEGPQYTARW